MVKFRKSKKHTKTHSVVLQDIAQMVEQKHLKIQSKIFEKDIDDDPKMIQYKELLKNVKDKNVYIRKLEQKLDELKQENVEFESKLYHILVE